MGTDRRSFLRKTGLLGAAVALQPLVSCAARGSTAHTPQASPPGPFSLPELGFAFNALEPSIDALTMEIHHGKHHAAYVSNLNKALESGGAYSGLTLEEINASVKPGDAAVRNNAGGHYNHSAFWRWIRPGGAPKPQGALLSAIVASFGSEEAFRNQFTEAAKARFGSGWAWLARDADGKLFVTSTANQDNPLMRQVTDRPGRPVLGIDVWEHAYYLKYQNRRPDYIAAFMGLINWDVVAADLEAAGG